MTTRGDLPSATTTAISSSQSLRQGSNSHALQHESVTQKDAVIPGQDVETRPVANRDNVAPTVDSPPNGGYGWVCVVCVCSDSQAVALCPKQSD